jgi:hypothetical protein
MKIIFGAIQALIVGSFLLLLTDVCYATSHVFVRTEEGVWLASDTLQLHNDGRTVQALTRCKVAGSPGQLFFNAGYFRDVNLLRLQEAALPLDVFERTRFSVVNLLSANHMDLSDLPGYTPAAIVVQAGVIQVKNGRFTAVILDQTGDFRIINHYVQRFKIGVPHGFGNAVKRVNSQADSDPVLASWIAQNPKEELLKLLQEEAAMRPGEVGGPFTILLLRNDGTIEDFSDQPVCNVLGR